MSERRFSFSGASDSTVLPSLGGDGALRILLVGPDTLALAGLAGLLADEADLAIVDQVVPREAGVGAITRSIRLHHPDAIVWDAGGAPAVPNFMTDLTAGELPVLALVANEEAAHAALASGARGAALRSGAPERIAAAARAMSQGLIVVDEEVSDALLGRMRAPMAALPVDPLTAREQEVVQLLAQGLSNKAIGERLRISEHTAKFHLNAILSKLGAQTRTDAVVRAARMGLILL